MNELIREVNESPVMKVLHEINRSWPVEMLREINRTWPIVAIRTAIAHRETRKNEPDL